MGDDTLFDIEPVGRTDPQSPQLFRPVARKDDPDTSHKAAQSVRGESKTQDEILEILKHGEPMTDDQIALAHFRGIGELGWTPVSPSGLRSRRAELVDQEKVKDSGTRGVTPSGRTSIRWVVCNFQKGVHK